MVPGGCRGWPTSGSSVAVAAARYWLMVRTAAAGRDTAACSTVDPRNCPTTTASAPCSARLAAVEDTYGTLIGSARPAARPCIAISPKVACALSSS